MEDETLVIMSSKLDEHNECPSQGYDESGDDDSGMLYELTN